MSLKETYLAKQRRKITGVKLIFPELGYFLLEETRTSGMESKLPQCNLEQVTLRKLLILNVKPYS